MAQAVALEACTTQCVYAVPVVRTRPHPYRVPVGQHGVKEAVQVAVQSLVGYSVLSKAVQVWQWGNTQVKFFLPADHLSWPQVPSPPETVATAA